MPPALTLQAGLIIVYANSGRTASLIAKYRPTMPIVTLVVPTLKSNSLSWDLSGRSLARQCLIMRGGGCCLLSSCNACLLCMALLPAVLQICGCTACLLLVCIVGLSGRSFAQACTVTRGRRWLCNILP